MFESEIPVELRIQRRLNFWAPRFWFGMLQSLDAGLSLWCGSRFFSIRRGRDPDCYPGFRVLHL